VVGIIINNNMKTIRQLIAEIRNIIPKAASPDTAKQRVKYLTRSLLKGQPKKKLRLEGEQKIMRAQKAGKLPLSKLKNFVGKQKRRIDTINANPDAGLDTRASKLRGSIYNVLESSAWQRKEGKNPEGGLNKKGVAAYRRENPGSKLQTAVTTPPSKLKPGSKAAKRRKSFCARMGGMPGPMKKPNGEPTRKALSLRKWNC